ncbi:MAG: hypothetical protein MUE44_30100 [Oscillatoriaceae cyanobacterium Prado104]|nr:hypothetical protein [Oscillatoriaceae cyanobacterium Prado104]
MKSRCYFLIFIFIGLSLTSCRQPKLFQEFDRTFKNSNAIEQLSASEKTDDVMLDRSDDRVQENRDKGKFDRTAKLSPEESAIVLGIFGLQLLCYLLVWKFRGREEANRMLRRSRIRK